MSSDLAGPARHTVTFPGTPMMSDPPVVINLDDTTSVDYAVVSELRSRVALRLSTDDTKMSAEDRREMTRALVLEELEQWVLHETERGRPAPPAPAEDRLVDAIVAELAGLGRLEPLLARRDIEDIHFEGSAPTMLRLTNGQIVQGPPIADSDAELVQLLQSIASRFDDGQTSREFSTANPVLNVRLKGITQLGARLSASMDVVPRPMGTIRMHQHVDVTLDELHRLDLVDTPMREFLRAVAQEGASAIVSGTPGAGKTTLLRGLINEIPWSNILVTVEDERELGTHLLNRHAVVKTFEQRLANAEGMGGFSMSDALNEALRLSPTRLIIGEVRGAAAVHVLDAVTTGVAGVMATLHTPYARGVFDRMLVYAQKAVPAPGRELIMTSMSNFDLVIHVERNRDNQRYVTEIIELGNVGDNGYPDAASIFRPGPDGRGVPVPGAMSQRLTERLASVGFDSAWLRQENADWQAWRQGRAS